MYKLYDCFTFLIYNFKTMSIAFTLSKSIRYLYRVIVYLSIGCIFKS